VGDLLQGPLLCASRRCSESAPLEGLAAAWSYSALGRRWRGRVASVPTVRSIC